VNLLVEVSCKLKKSTAEGSGGSGVDVSGKGGEAAVCDFEGGNVCECGRRSAEHGSWVS
jgi:hypothetical protein